MHDLFATKRQYIEQVLSYYLTIQENKSRRKLSDRGRLPNPSEQESEASFAEQYFGAAILNKVIVRNVDTEEWAHAVQKGNALLAIDYLNEIWAKEVYQQILLKLFESEEFTEGQI